jgi:hypothetical protein
MGSSSAGGSMVDVNVAVCGIDDGVHVLVDNLDTWVVDVSVAEGGRSVGERGTGVVAIG